MAAISFFQQVNRNFYKAAALTSLDATLLAQIKECNSVYHTSFPVRRVIDIRCFCSDESHREKREQPTSYVAALHLYQAPLRVPSLFPNASGEDASKLDSFLRFVRGKAWANAEAKPSLCHDPPIGRTRFREGVQDNAGRLRRNLQSGLLCGEHGWRARHQSRS